MANTRRVFAIVVVLAFFGYLLWSTLASQRAQCQVCVAFKGGRNCATASAATVKDATRNAQTTACGVLTAGMDQSIACDNVQPEKVKCD